MPRIEEYLPETEGAGPVGGLDPKTEAVGRVGAGIEKLGQSIEQAGDVLYRQQAKTEVDDASVSASQRNVDYQARLQQETQDGTLDVAKFKQDYQDEVDAQADTFKTQAGKNYFDRISARIGGRLTIGAIHGTSQIAAVKARNAWNSSQYARSNAISQDPSSFSFNQELTEADIQAKIDTGLPAKEAPKLLQEAGADNFMSAIRGYYKLGDTGQKDKNGQPIDGPAIAKQILDSGDGNDYLSPSQMKLMYAEIKAQVRDNRAEAVRSAKDAQDAQADNDEEVRKNFVPLLQAGKLTPNMVYKLSDPDEQYKWVQRIEAHAKDKYEKSDPAVLNDLYRRINLPDGEKDKIRTRDQLMEYLGHGATPTDVDRISGMLNKSRDGEVLRENRHRFLEYATGELVKKDAYGNADPDGQQNMLNFTIALQHAENQKLQNNESTLSLFDQKSKDYFGNELPKYKLTPMQIIKKKAGQLKSTGSSQPPPSHPDIVTKDRKTLTWSEADKGYVEK